MIHRLSLRLRTCAVLSAVLWSFACTSGQTGGQVGSPTEDSSCLTTTNPIAPDAKSPLGFSAEDVIAWAADTHTATATWGPPQQEAHLVELTPEPGSTEIELELSYADGSVAFVKRDVEARTDEGIEPALQPEPGACQDFLQIELEAHLRTSNGAFDDTFTVQLHATSAYKAQLHVPFDLSTLQGNLTLVPVEEGATIEQPVWSAELEPNAFSGTIRVVVEHQQGEVTSGGNVTIASWADPPLEGEP